jgi:hypothetical protein
VAQNGPDFATSLGVDGRLKKDDILAGLWEVIVCIDDALSHQFGMDMPKPFPIGADGKRMNLDADELAKPLHRFAVERLGDNEPCGGLGICGDLDVDSARCRSRDWSKR